MLEWDGDFEARFGRNRGIQVKSWRNGAIEGFQMNSWRDRGILVEYSGKDITVIEVDSEISPVDGGVEVCVVENDGR